MVKPRPNRPGPRNWWPPSETRLRPRCPSSSGRRGRFRRFRGRESPEPGDQSSRVSRGVLVGGW